MTTTLKQASPLKPLPIEVTTLTVPSRIKPVNPQLREKLTRYRDENKLTLSELGKKLGYSEGMVSKYLADKFEGDVDGFEDRVIDLLKSDALTKENVNDVKTFETRVTRLVKNTLELMRKTGVSGVIHGDAGVGKTRACELYAKNNPLTVFITIGKHAGGGVALIERALWAALDTAHYRTAVHGTHGEYLATKMRGSGRIIVIDNAQRLGRSAREWLFDWQDSTGCSVALVGNPEIVDTLRKNDQQFSRVPLMVEVTLGNTLGEVVCEIIRQLWPEALEEILEAATAFAAKKGQLRKLSACVRVARQILAQRGTSTATLAFRQAAEMSLSEQDYATPRNKYKKPRL